jgi:hypothetical protein
MSTYVWFNGELVDRQVVDMVETEFRDRRRAKFPAPRVSRFEAMTSPVTEKMISSWRERDRDMQAADAVDPRDIPKTVFEKRKRIVERNVRSGTD